MKLVHLVGFTTKKFFYDAQSHERKILLADLTHSVVSHEI